ncbi:carboxypeptidase-like regulatory domain-containing protein, partial [Fulvivirga aurantia]|uniref:carboxypeptidase-like regulatory domain-containing protein n=1 Tax=Fulvivirga aurantia TaxID=2529383 RepID=UPI001FE342A1
AIEGAVSKLKEITNIVRIIIVQLIPSRSDTLIYTLKSHSAVIKRIFVLLLVVISAQFVTTKEAAAQGKQRVLQLSGVVLGEDSVSGIPGVHIYVPKAGRGTTTNRVGYFSMPVLVGDEVVISSVGYEKQYYKIPDHESDNITVIIELVSDTTFLETVEIMPFPTEEIFKEAVIALNLPIDKPVNNENLNDELLALMLRSTPMDATMNHRYYLDNWTQNQYDKYGPRPNPLLNPFNWARFFKSLKKK